MLRTLILKLTHRLWNREISRILCRAYGERLISSTQLHSLSAAFDPTQNHIVYGPRVPYGFTGSKGVLCCGITHRKVMEDHGEAVL